MHFIDYMKVRDIMRPGPVTIDRGESLGAAQRAMKRARIRHLPVLHDGKLVGILSERDVLAARRGIDEDWWRQTVGDAMFAPVQTTSPDESLTAVAARLAAAKIGALPVAERGKLVGIVTVGDVLDAEVRTAMSPAPISLATAADAMTPFPITVAPDAPIAEAVAKMIDHHVRHLPVIDASATVVGIVSERDLRTAIGDPVLYLEKRGRLFAGHRVADVMTAPAQVVAFDRPLLDIARLFADQRHGALPVLDAFGALIGIVSYVDALRVLAG
jgi:acetoin utilization protein AcuB